MRRLHLRPLPPVRPAPPRSSPPLRCYTSPAHTSDASPTATDTADTTDTQQHHDDPSVPEGALTRRLRAMTDDALTDAAFSPDLKAQLERRIAQADLRSVTSATSELPTTISSHDRELATAPAWTGAESVHDANLRMLNDAHKPLRLGRAPRPQGVQMPTSIDTGRSRAKAAPGLRLANARDRSGVYASIQGDESLEQSDREKRLQGLKERFEPGARAIVPGSIQGLASLANKRIEDAIARGQFKNIPRGKGKNVERDHNANSPFIDTTEYFMNKIIQRQEIVPPWIERQQELAAAVAKFRATLRLDWKRHAARMLASKGGTLQDQIRRAEAYAKAEEIANPTRKLLAPTSINHRDGEDKSQVGGTVVELSNNKQGAAVDSSQQSTEAQLNPNPDNQNAAHKPSAPPAPFPFRDPDWERAETPYLSVAIKDLNDKTRSYNLQAPELAKKPYYSLERELSACYAQVAPLLPEAILDRARKPAVKAESFGQNLSDKTLFGGLGGGAARVCDERTTKQYGFKQFWNDLFAPKPKSPY